MARYECLDNYIFEALLQDLDLEWPLLATLFPYYIFINLFQTSLVAISTSFLVIVLNEVCILLVYRIISQMHINISKVATLR